MVRIEDLRDLGKTVMGAVVDAELLGLNSVGDHLSMAFDEVVRVAAELREVPVRAEGEKLLEKTRDRLDGG